MNKKKSQDRSDGKTVKSNSSTKKFQKKGKEFIGEKRKRNDSNSEDECTNEHVMSSGQSTETLSGITIIRT